MDAEIRIDLLKAGCALRQTALLIPVKAAPKYCK
jgi:hypothetical protein